MAETYKPLRFDGRWLWHNAEHPLADPGNYPDHLPAKVFDALEGHIIRPGGRVTGLVKAYPTREAAMAALAIAEADPDA